MTTLPIMIATSPDGVTWTHRPSPWDGTPTDISSGAAIEDIAWNGSMAVCVTQGGYGPGTYTAVGSSPDGINWTQRVIPGLDNGYGYSASGVAWSPTLGLWCISVPGYISNTPGLIWTSPDAITWTAQATPWDPHVFPVQPTLQDVTWSPAINKFVAIGSEYGNYNPPSTSRNHVLMTSPDGINWTSIDTPFDGVAGGIQSAMVYVESSSSMVIVSGNNSAYSTNQMMTSTDGVTWTPQSTNTYGGAGVYGDGSLWVLGGSSNPYNWTIPYGSSNPVYHDIIATSPDGATWTPRATPWDAIVSTLTNPFVYRPAWSPTLSQWVAAGSERPLTAAPGSGHSILTSPDAINWTWHSTPFDTGATSGMYGGVHSAVWAASLGLWIAGGIGYYLEPIVPMWSVGQIRWGGH